MRGSFGGMWRRMTMRMSIVDNWTNIVDFGEVEIISFTRCRSYILEEAITLGERCALTRSSDIPDIP